jgi:prolipoprotein diacylglyceryltransferase
MYPFIGNQNWVSSYGLVLLIALVTCWWLARRNAKAAGIDPSHIDVLVPAALLIGLAVSMLQPEHRVRLIPLITVCLGVVIAYSRLTHQSIGRMTDVLALPTIAAIMIQRVGCFLAGCCWGDPIGHGVPAWMGVDFPAGSFAHEQHVTLGLIGPDAASSLPVHATQLYEAVLLLPLFVLLARPKMGRLSPGELTLLAAGGYAVVRFAIEFLRADNVAVIGPLSGTQLVCILVALCLSVVFRMNTNAIR